MDKALKKALKDFAQGYIACAQNYEGIDDEWQDFMNYCLNFYDNGKELIVSVYPLKEITYEGKTYMKEDMNNCLCENLLAEEA